MTILTTDKQKKLLFLLYSFRYLTIIQFQKILNHKDPHRIKEWLKDLKNKKCVAVIQDKSDPTKPFIYCLDTKARYILNEDENCDETILGRLYKEKNNKGKFVNKNLFIVDIYLFFLSQQEKNSELNFFTQNDLEGYSYFPEELPSAYIAVEENKETTRYLLEYFDEYTPPFVLRNKVKAYIKYAEDGTWEANTENSPFPTILFVCPTENLKKHILMYAKAKLEKSFTDIDLFVTTKSVLSSAKPNQHVWKEVK